MKQLKIDFAKLKGLLHYKQRVAATTIGLHPDTLYRKLKGEREFTMSELNKISEFLNCDTMVFLMEVESDEKTESQRFVEKVVVDDFEYQVIVESDLEAGGYVVECPAIKGCVSQGETKEEALIMIQDALIACLEVLEEREAHA